MPSILFRMSLRRRGGTSLAIACLAGLGVTTAGASAADVHWSASAGAPRLFGDPMHWSPMQVPGVDDAAIFDVDDVFEILFGQDHFSERLRVRSGDLTFNLQGHSYTLSLPVSPLDPLAISVGERAGDEAALHVHSGALVGGEVMVGQAGAGTLRLTSGGVLESTDISIGREGGSTGMFVVSGDDARLVNSAGLNVGYGGQGTLRVENGGSAASGDIRIGAHFGGVGEAVVTGAGSRLESLALDIGGHGIGSLRIENGGEVENEGATIGAIGLGGQGAALVTGTGSVWTVQSLTVGHNVDGTLRIDDGGVVRGARLETGIGGEATSAIVVDGAGSLLDIDGPATIGSSTGNESIENTLRVENGGHARTGDTSLGDGQQTRGVATVTGGGSSWTSGVMRLGSQGDGQLFIADGGRVTSQRVSLGGDVDMGTGTVAVAGAGSEWAIDEMVEIVRGSLLVEDGGVVRSGAARLGHDYFGAASATVTGDGSLWDIAGDFELVAQAPGSVATRATLAIGPGGRVEVSGDFLQFADQRVLFTLAGTDPGIGHGVLDVEGAMLPSGWFGIGGVFEVALVDGFAPSLGDAFDLLDFGAFESVFDSVLLPTLEGALSWDQSRLYDEGVLTVVPAPGASLALLGVLGWARRRR